MDQTSNTLSTEAFGAAEDCELALTAAMSRLADFLEAKANFNPNQPRVPAGLSTGGQWTLSGAAPSWMPTWTELERAAGEAANRVNSFLKRNQRAINRAVGGVQMLGGGAQMVGGGAMVTVGVPTSSVGAGVVLAGVGGWMVYNGYDTFDAGWRALRTGEAQETLLHTTLLKMGLSDGEAVAVEIALSGVGPTAAAKLSSRGLDAAAKAGLARRAVRPFASTGIVIRVGNRSIWDEPDIVKRGLAWEEYDAARTGFIRLPPNEKTFDQAGGNYTIAVSNKTLDLTRAGYSRDASRALYGRLKSYIDQVANYQAKRGSKSFHPDAEVRQRRIHLLLPRNNALPGQELQISAAEEYARSRGVILQVDYGY